MLTKKTAKQLAVAYQAYMQAMDENNKNGQEVWGRLLHDAQVATGIELLSNVPRFKSEAEEEYNRDLALRIRNGQVGSGMKFR